MHWGSKRYDNVSDGEASLWAEIRNRNIPIKNWQPYTAQRTWGAKSSIQSTFHEIVKTITLKRMKQAKRLSHGEIMSKCT